VGAVEVASQAPSVTILVKSCQSTDEVYVSRWHLWKPHDGTLEVANRTDLRTQWALEHATSSV
jgi:hypothetical protein